MVVCCSWVGNTHFVYGCAAVWGVARDDEVGAVRQRAQLGREELSSQLVFLIPLIFIHRIHFIREALVILSRAPKSRVLRVLGGLG